MNIAFIVGEFPSVSETFILWQLTRLLDLGHRVDIYAYRRGKPDVTHQEIARYGMMNRTRYFKEFTRVRGRARRLARAIPIITRAVLRDPMRVRRWIGVLRQRGVYEGFNLLFTIAPFWAARYDVIHCHFGPHGHWALFLRDWTDAKFICSFYGYDVTSYPQKQGRDVYQALFRRGDLFLALSEHMRRQLEALGCDQRRIRVQRLGIDVARFASYGARVGARRTVRILTVARHVEKKGLEYAIRAVGRVVTDHPDLRYEIVGGGPLAPTLQGLIQDLGLSERVALLGPCSNETVSKLLSEADIFLLPSVTASNGDQEGIPTSLVEAQAAGLPVISTWHSGIPELVQDGRSGFLVPERDVDALADKLDFLIAHPDVRRAFGEAGRAIAAEQYDDLRQAGRLVELYLGLQSRHAAPQSTLEQKTAERQVPSADPGEVAEEPM